MSTRKLILHTPGRHVAYLENGEVRKIEAVTSSDGRRDLVVSTMDGRSPSTFLEDVSRDEASAFLACFAAAAPVEDARRDLLTAHAVGAAPPSARRSTPAPLVTMAVAFAALGLSLHTAGLIPSFGTSDADLRAIVEQARLEEQLRMAEREIPIRTEARPEPSPAPLQSLAPVATPAAPALVIDGVPVEPPRTTEAVGDGGANDPDDRSNVRDTMAVLAQKPAEQPKVEVPAPVTAAQAPEPQVVAAAAPTPTSPTPPAAQPQAAASSEAPAPVAATTDLLAALAVPPQGASTGKPAVDPTQAHGGTIEERAAAADALARQTRDAATQQVAGAGADKAMADLSVLKEALRKVQSGEKLDPTFLSQLPHDLATTLASQGATLSSEETIALRTNGEAQVVRLSPEQMTKMRDKDGLPTVTETNVWAASNDRITLPFPGGGDIVSKEDFEVFGLGG